MIASATDSHRALLLIGLAVVSGLVLSQLVSPPADRPALEWLEQPRPVSAFKLISGDADFTADSLHGHWQLLALGFTHCPDICPTTLAKLAKLASSIKEKHIRVLFVSIDPQRDSPPRLAEYVSFFDTDIVAVTGSDTELHHLAESLGMNFRREGSADKPRISHSPTIALIGPDGFLRARLRPGFDQQKAARELKTHIGTAS